MKAHQNIDVFHSAVVYINSPQSLIVFPGGLKERHSDKSAYIFVYMYQSSAAPGSKETNLTVKHNRKAYDYIHMEVTSLQCTGVIIEYQFEHKTVVVRKCHSQVIYGFNLRQIYASAKA